MITIISDTVGGYVDQARWRDLSVISKKRSAARKLARMILDTGIPDTDIECRSPAGALLWTHRSLVEFARFDTSEDPKPRTVRWVPNPLFAKAAE